MFVDTAQKLQVSVKDHTTSGCPSGKARQGEKGFAWKLCEIVSNHLAPVLDVSGALFCKLSSISFAAFVTFTLLTVDKLI